MELTKEQGEELIKKLTSVKQLPTCVICGNQSFAINNRLVFNLMF